MEKSMIPEYAKNSKEEIPFGKYMEQYAQMNPQEASERTGVLYEEEKKRFLLPMLHRSYYVTWPELVITGADEKETAYSALENEAAAKILALRFLLNGVKAGTTGKFMTYREIPWGEVYYRQFNGRCMMRLAFSYGNRLEEFKKVCEAVGAKPVKAGDAGYQFEIFPGYFVQFLLWAGDDEFPPSSQILFSDNLAAAFHGEDLVVICDEIINTLKKIGR